MTPERLLITAAKCLAATMIWIALAVILFRFGVGSLWGSRSDLGVAAAPFLAAFSVLALAYLAVAIIRYIKKDIAQ